MTAIENTEAPAAPAIDRAKALLASFDTDCACIACEEPCVSCQDALCRYEDILCGYIGAAEALKEEGHDSQKWMCMVGRTVPLEKASCPGCKALAEVEKLFLKSEN